MGTGITVVGSGYVGTVVAAGLASIGHAVTAVEGDHDRLRTLCSGRAPFHEPGLTELLEKGLAAKSLRFTDRLSDAVEASDVIFVCVGAPSGLDGRPDMRPLQAAGRQIGAVIHDQVVVNKSTVPIGGERWLACVIDDGRPARRRRGSEPSVVANPEFLREGSAIGDFLCPQRIVLGGDDPTAIDRVAEVYRPILDQSFPGGDVRRRPILVRTTAATAEALKYASNAFLATKISFINEVANICRLVGADVMQVATAMGLDPRIGREFLRSGVGWGGSCLGKDLAALILTARERGYEPQLLDAVRAVNEYQRNLVVKALAEHLMVLEGRRICLLGLAFKPGTDDLRDAPAVDIAGRLAARGAVVTGHDPVVRHVPQIPSVSVAADPYQAAEDADAIVLITDWPEYLDLDYTRLRRGMRGNFLLDGRNFLSPQALWSAGFRYERLADRRIPDPARPKAREVRLDELDPERLADGRAPTP